MKRQRTITSSDSSDNESPSTSFSSGKYVGKTGTSINEPKKPAEVFRKDLISAMKLPDSHYINPDDYYLLADTWKEEWEKGVQVPASPDTIPQASLRLVAEKSKENLFTRQRKYIQCSAPDPVDTGYVNIVELAESVCHYDLDDMDLFWLQELNVELDEMGYNLVNEDTMEKVMEALERQCYDKMNHAIETEEGLGIEYDEDVICDVCRSPDSEEGNEMVFCDKCNICVHQACYGIVKVPQGSWLCRTCVLSIHPQCVLCPKRGGAMKATRAGTKWAHVSCALWIPEVSIACPERMEPITKVSHIPPSRWALVCSLCKLKTGACIQCSVKSCITAFHVTCAFEYNLEMKTILDEGDEVKFKSYCLKHSKPKSGEPGQSPSHPKPTTETEKTSLRAQKLKELEEEFFALVQVEETAVELGLPEYVLDFIFQYWKLKRKSNFNKPLLPPNAGENALLHPKEDSIHTRMRMFMHLRQDLERVRNLCYMVSRREKLKLSHSKAQEQIFSMQVKLINQELATGLPLSCPPESVLFRTPPRITLKLKMPKVNSGTSKTVSKSKNGPLCPDNSGNVYKSSTVAMLSLLKASEKLKSHHHRVHKGDDYNGLLSSSGHSQPETVGVSNVFSSTPRGKPSALHIGMHVQSSNGDSKLDQERACPSKSNGVVDKAVKHRDSSCQTTYEQGLSNHFSVQGGGTFRKSAMEHFSRSFKEVTDSLVRTTEDLRSSEKSSRKAATKERLWAKSVPERQSGSKRSYQESDGYCPDLELSDSEPEINDKRKLLLLQRNSSECESPGRNFGKSSSCNKLKLVQRSSVQR
ncbi:protein Jade-3 isoform X2 [Polypterus senegalus]|uniref:protein Jade-3 isoform X2 n=1 Tax=Polypterus senegalus TaxID=55291 RepID=UPI0019638CBC|nr:protein Jade-3 isoform X2 [Polypterus senegalus]